MTAEYQKHVLGISTKFVTTHGLTKFTCENFKKIQKIKKFTSNFLWRVSSYLNLIRL